MIDISYHAKIRLYVPNELKLTKKNRIKQKTISLFNERNEKKNT